MVSIVLAAYTGVGPVAGHRVEVNGLVLAVDGVQVSAEF